MFNGSHYELIRNCPEYRTACMLEDMRLELEPAWAQPQAEPPAERYIKPKHLSFNQWDEINQLKAQVIYLRNQVNTLQRKEYPGRRNNDKPF